MEQKEQQKEQTEKMDQKEFEQKLDGYADRFSKAVSDGVRKLEDTFEKGKENVKRDMESGSGERKHGTPRTGMILVGLGIAWLLFTLGAFAQPIFPILLIVLGLYFVLRNRGDRNEERAAYDGSIDKTEGTRDFDTKA